MSNTEYVDFILDVLSSFRNIKLRKMFGGYGFYKDGIFFALIIADILYFKVDDVNLADYKANGSQPFSYVNKNGKRVAMSYWKVPGDILENNDKLTQWVEKSIAAARRAKHK